MHKIIYIRFITLVNVYHYNLFGGVEFKLPHGIILHIKNWGRHFCEWTESFPMYHSWKFIEDHVPDSKRRWFNVDFGSDWLFLVESEKMILFQCLINYEISVVVKETLNQHWINVLRPESFQCWNINIKWTCFHPVTLCASTHHSWGFSSRQFKPVHASSSQSKSVNSLQQLVAFITFQWQEKTNW